MASSKNLSKKVHDLMNTFPRLLGVAEKVGKIKFYDVGTGNCNAIYNRAGTVLFYYDFGGNMGTGAQTYPYRADPLVDAGDGKLASAFDCATTTSFVMSHWDNDHVYSLKAQPATKDRNWLGPREDIAPTTLDFVAKLGKNLRIWYTGDAGTKTYSTTGGVDVTLVRCRGNALQTSSKNDARNDTGITMIMTVKTPTRAADAAKQIEEALKTSTTDAAAAALAGASVAGNDIYKECVVTAANAAAARLPTNATAVSTAGKDGLRAAAVKGAAKAAMAVHDAAKTSTGDVAKAMFDATVTAAAEVDPIVEAMLKAIATSATLSSKDAFKATKLALDLTTLNVKGAFDVLRAGFDQAVLDNKDAPKLVLQMKAAAGIFWATDPLVKPVLDTAASAASFVATDAVAAFKAALAALPPGPPSLEVGRAALTSTLAYPTNAPLVAMKAIEAAVASLGAVYPLLGRVLGPALACASTMGKSAIDVANAFATGLDQAPVADCIKAVLAMKKKLLEGGADNDAMKTAVGDPTDDGYYANRVIKAARDKIKELAGVDQPADVLAAGLAALLDVPVEWKTRVLLTGDACFQAVPTTSLPATDEWDVLLAYHHGSRDGLTKPAKPDGNHFKPPRAKLEGSSLVVYSAGRRAAGTYVHAHPEPIAITRYEKYGWTKAAHTHEWPPVGSAARGDRLYKLPYMP